MALLLCAPASAWALEAAASSDHPPSTDPWVGGASPDGMRAHTHDIRARLDEALAAGKSGLLVYFGQPDCAYCHQFI